MAFYTYPKLPLAPAILTSLALLLCPPAQAASKAQKAQGAALFRDKGCAHCHGPSGFGGSDSGPDLSNVRKELKPAEIAQQIHDGGKNMPPFGDTLTHDEIASLVAFLHSKRNSPPGWVKHQPSAPAPTPVPKSDPD
jgi:mono/diheme cytochrome c family protein